METLDIFAIDPRGYVVMCNDKQLDKIYAHHRELCSFWATVQDMKNAISNAPAIYQSTHGKEFNVYYLSRKGKNTELKVVVKFNNDNEGLLCAAQPSTVGQRKTGEIMIWPITKS